MSVQIERQREKLLRLERAAPPTPHYFLNSALFPVYPYWRWVTPKGRDITLAPRETYTIWDDVAAGWLVYFMIRVNNPDTVVYLDLEADGIIELAVTPRYINDLNQRERVMISVQKYDTTNNDYVLEFVPPLGLLGIPFRGRAKVAVENPTTTPAMIKEYIAWIILIRGPEV